MTPNNLKLVQHITKILLENIILLQFLVFHNNKINVEGGLFLNDQINSRKPMKS